MKNAGPAEITEANRQAADAPSGGLRLKTSKRLTYRKIGTTLAPSLAHPLGASTHMLAAPLRRTSQRGTTHAAIRTGQTPAISPPFPKMTSPRAWADLCMVMCAQARNLSDQILADLAQARNVRRNIVVGIHWAMTTYSAPWSVIASAPRSVP